MKTIPRELPVLLRTSLKQPPIPSILAPLFCPPPVLAGTNKDRRGGYEGGNNNNDKNTMESPAGINSASSVATDSLPTTAAIMAQLVYQTKLMLQLQQHQQTKTTVSATVVAAAAAAEDAATSMPWGSSPMEMSTNSDERSFNFARTRIYLYRPSFFSPQSGPPHATTTQQQQQQQQRVLKTTRTVVMENDASKEAADRNLETGPMEQQQQQPPPPSPLPQVRQTPILLRILVMPFWLTYRYVQFEFQVLQAF
jgi:hypothetical protein